MHNNLFGKNLIAHFELNLICLAIGVYKNNGYLMVSCNGGLNQMRAAVSGLLSITLGAACYFVQHYLPAQLLIFFIVCWLIFVFNFHVFVLLCSTDL